MLATRLVILLLALSACVSYGPPKPPKPAPVTLPPPRESPSGPKLQDLVSGTTQRLQAVSVVNDKVVWVSGTGGTYAVTLDGGATWRTATVPEADSLEFRDVAAFDNDNAYLLSAGNGTNSRIYRTVDAGVDWAIQFVNRDSAAFYDCFAFWDKDNGLAWSDAVNGRFPYVTTTDGGEVWRRHELDGATANEGAFAASGTCVTTQGNAAAFVATGGGEKARVLRSADRGLTWQSATTPITQGSRTTGLTSVAFRNPRDGIAAGGDIAGKDSATAEVIRTSDGGVTWTLAARPTFPGPVFAVVYVPGTDATVVAVGPGGASWSADEGRTWRVLDSLSYWSAGFAGKSGGWLVGPGGRITKVIF
ncbi:MAG TPA: hypothetical protein VMG41_12550 [Gemmatimonadales bacterium]|nr:hypothetical protein [Gemmatimonadales bacterium]